MESKGECIVTRISLNKGESQPWLQDILDWYFSEYHLRSEDILDIEMHANIIDFPRSLTCDCKRCRSPFQLHAVAGKIVMITTETDTYFADLPGDPESFQHVWEEEKKLS